jgi:very-short-patch-repair endonuclease
VDGDIHDLQQEEDAGREKVLRVVRFRNDEAMKSLSPSLRFGDASRSAVVGRIKKFIEK